MVIKQTSEEFSTSLDLDFKTLAKSAAQAELPVTVVFKLMAGSEPNVNQLAEIECTMKAIYALRPEFIPTDEQVASFQTGNAVFNCWPYFREFLQSNLQKMGYPISQLPLLRLEPECSKQPDPELRPPRPKRLAAKTSKD